MKLSTKGIYGLRAMIDLARNSENEAVSLSSIAQRQQISEGYLQQLIAKLKRAHIVNSVRGAQGGYLLSRPSEEITAGDILRAVEGDLNPVECCGIENDSCHGSDACVSKYVWQRLNQGMNEIADDIKLSALVAMTRQHEPYPTQTINCGNKKQESAT